MRSGIYRLQQTTVKVFLAGIIALLAVGAGYLTSAWIGNSKYIAQFGLAQILFGMLALAVGVWLLAMVLARGLKAVLTPLGAILIGFEIFILIGPLLLPEWAPYLYSDPSRIIRAWVATLVGLSGFLIGYNFLSIVQKRRLRKSGSSFMYRQLQIRRLFWIGLLLVLYRLVFFRIWYSESGVAEYFLTAGHFAVGLVGGYWFWGWWFANIATFTGVTCMARAVFGPEQMPKYYRILGFFFLLLSLYSSLLEGNRGRFAMPAITVVLLIVLLSEGKGDSSFSIRMFSRLAAVAFIGLILTGIVWQTEFRALPLTDALARLRQGELNLSGPSLAERGGDMLIYLDRILDEFGTVTPFWWGSSYIAPFLLLIPREVWPGKPVGVAAYLNNAGPTIVGEWYANFGWIGIFIGMAFFGYMLRRWYNFYLAYRHSDLAIMMYAMSYGVLIYEVRGDFNTVTSYWLYAALLLLMIWLTVASKKTQPASLKS